MTIPTKVVCSPYTIEFSKTGELFGLMYRGERLGRCQRLGLSNDAEGLMTRLSVTAFLSDQSNWVLHTDSDGNPTNISWGDDNPLTRVVPESVKVEDHDFNENLKLLSFEVIGPFEIEVRDFHDEGGAPAYPLDEESGDEADNMYIALEDVPGTATEPPDTRFVRYYFPRLPSWAAECECGAGATGSLRHSDYCPRSKS